MTEGRYLTRKNKDGKYDIYLSGFCPMYCATYDTKEECKEHIKNQKKGNPKASPNVKNLTL